MITLNSNKILPHGEAMDDESKNKLKDVLSTIDPVEFKWDETNTTVGIIAQEVGGIMSDGTIDLGGGYDTITVGPVDTTPIDLGSIDMSSITITGAVGSSGAYLSSNGITGSTWTIGSSQPSINIGSEGTKSYIQTNKHKIDIDELGDMMETLKKRLLILTPNFEQMEKYPMLKELYDEYKAMERLLGGPDSEKQE